MDYPGYRLSRRSIPHIRPTYLWQDLCKLVCVKPHASATPTETTSTLPDMTARSLSSSHGPDLRWACYASLLKRAQAWPVAIIVSNTVYWQAPSVSDVAYSPGQWQWGRCLGRSMSPSRPHFEWWHSHQKSTLHKFPCIHTHTLTNAQGKLAYNNDMLTVTLFLPLFVASHTAHSNNVPCSRNTWSVCMRRTKWKAMHAKNRPWSPRTWSPPGSHSHFPLLWPP